MISEKVKVNCGLGIFNANFLHIVQPWNDLANCLNHL